MNQMKKIKEIWKFDIKTGRYICTRVDWGSYIKKDNWYKRKRKVEIRKQFIKSMEK